MLQSAVPRARTMAPSASHAGALRLSVLGLAAALALSACNESQDKPPQAASVPLPPATESAQPVATPVAYVPPSAETLYQMVAPIALYPDKLVAQVLAASTYPDQVGAAEVWLGQNPGLKPQELQDAVNGQDWDPSVKSLAQFPNVLAQLSSNIPWTTALGRAYYNDPADVMNAIQVMRQRAYKAGTLKDSSRLKVAVAAADAPPRDPQPAPQDMGEPLSSMLPVPVIDAPSQFIEITPAQPDTVYVPQYDPGVVYGEPLPVYGGYRPIVAPQPVYVGSSAAPVVAGLIGFGAGVILAESVDRRPWGWNSWGMRWGEPGYRWHRNEPPPPPSRRPAVIYNNNTYVTRSTTVVQNIRNTQINNGGNVTHIANNPHVEPRPAGNPPNPPQGGDPRPGGMAAAALAGAAGLAGAAAAAHGGMPQRLGLRPPQGGPPASSQGMLPPGATQGSARHDGADRGRPGLRPDDRPQAALQPRMNPVPASQPGQFGKWPQAPHSTQAAGVQRPPAALPAAAIPGERGRDSRVPSWSSAAAQQGMRQQDRQDRDRSMADAARMRQQQQQQMEMQTARLRGEEQSRQQRQQQQAQRQAQMQMQVQARDQAREQAQMQARQQQLQQQQQQQQARAQEQMQARMQAQQQAQQQAQRQAQMQERQAQQQRMQLQQAQQAQARAQQQQARAQQEQRQQQQRMANASRPQERRGGRDERRDR
ncbi:DUF3300 domain-containing protein [Delftia lacustris]|uniref:DUF3300 domain-containing protein n=1 Tax=Delftia TaxID=80865 RepID=UPI001FCA80D0|nr:DUF3300 domain-containing protein [Delftia lacustris]BDE72952.1 hypothetical protein HQS1_40760 [Delftia lacustris]